MGEEFIEEFGDPQMDPNAQDVFLRKYYDEIFSALLSAPYTDARSDEIVPYEVTVFSDQPGLLKQK